MSFRAKRVADEPVQPFVWESAAARPMAAAPRPSAQPARGVEQADDQMRLASLERDAFAKGYAQGERAGTEAAATRVEGMLRRLGQTIEELAGLRAEMIRRTERQTVQLVLAIAERIVHREVTIDRGLLVGMARAALDRLGEHGSATIRLHPDDHKVIDAGNGFEDSPVRVVADPVVSRGGCLVQSDFGFMDASPESQFRELARALLSDSDAPDTQPADGIILK